MTAITIDVLGLQKYNQQNMKQNGLFRFEAIAQELVEGKLGRLFGGRLEPLDVAGRLAQVLEDNPNHETGPSTFVVGLNSEDYRYLIRANPNLADDIADAAWQIGHNLGGTRLERPLIKIVDDPTIRRHKVQITAESLTYSATDGDNTKTLSRDVMASSPMNVILSLDAFLIIQGRRHVPLDRPVITIGRRTENDIVIDIATVSRRHAQIRWRFGRFVLYDVSTRGKTWVNGYPTKEHVLQPGDVIALSDALLIYGEGREDHSPSQDEDSDDNTKTLVRPVKS